MICRQTYTVQLTLILNKNMMFNSQSHKTLTAIHQVYLSQLVIPQRTPRESLEIDGVEFL